MPNLLTIEHNNTVQAHDTENGQQITVGQMGETTTIRIDQPELNTNETNDENYFLPIENNRRTHTKYTSTSQKTNYRY